MIFPYDHHHHQAPPPQSHQPWTLSPIHASLFNRRGAPSLQFTYDGPASDHHHHLRILSETLGPMVQPGSVPFGLQAELGKLTAQEIMDAKALAASKSHSEAERRRRERINNHLAKLCSLLPSTTKKDGLVMVVVSAVDDLSGGSAVSTAAVETRWIGVGHRVHAGRLLLSSGIKLYYLESGVRQGNRGTQWVNMENIPKQHTNKDCGFFVMRYMREIISDKNLQFASKWTKKETKTGLVYTKEQIDEVREEWAAYVLKTYVHKP